jgi:hypothetical protein
VSGSGSGAPDPPDIGDLREDLLACGRAYVHREGRTAQVLARPTGLFQRVLSRAVDRGLIAEGVDAEILADVFPAIAYERVAARGLLLVEEDVRRVVDHVLLPALSAVRPAIAREP